MNNLILFILTSYGITLAIVESKIAKPVREYFKYRSKIIYALINCMMCTGFWVSTLLSTINPQTEYRILDGFLGMGCIYLIHLIQLTLEKKSDYKG